MQEQDRPDESGRLEEFEIEHRIETRDDLERELTAVIATSLSRFDIQMHDRPTRIGFLGDDEHPLEEGMVGEIGDPIYSEMPDLPEGVLTLMDVWMVASDVAEFLVNIVLPVDFLHEEGEDDER